MKVFFVVKGESDLFVVREEEADYTVGSEYDGARIIAKLDLPIDPRLDGLMEIEEILHMMLEVVDATYCQGRLHEQGRVERKLREMHDRVESFLLEW